MKKTIRNLFTIVIIFNSIFINKLIGQTRMNFVKGEELNNISFVEKGSLLSFTSDNVWLNNNLLNKRGAIRFTKKYMVYPCTIKTSDTEMEIDVYWSLGNDNYDCIIDWGGNVLEQFKLIEIDLNEYNKNIEKEDRKKKSQILTKLREIQNFSEIDTTDLSKLNLRKVELSKLLKSYNTNYKYLFESEPLELLQARTEINKINALVQKTVQKNDRKIKVQDSLRIYCPIICSIERTQSQIDTFVIAERSAQIIFNVFLRDSIGFWDNNKDSILIKKLITGAFDNFNSIFKTELGLNKILKMITCEINLNMFFEICQSHGFKFQIFGFKNQTNYVLSKLELFKVQEFNAYCEAFGELHNLCYDAIDFPILNQRTSKLNDQWHAFYDIGTVMNKKIDSVYLSLINILRTLQPSTQTPKINCDSVKIFNILNQYGTVYFCNENSAVLFKNFINSIFYHYSQGWELNFKNNSNLTFYSLKGFDNWVVKNVERSWSEKLPFGRNLSINPNNKFGYYERNYDNGNEAGYYFPSQGDTLSKYSAELIVEEKNIDFLQEKAEINNVHIFKYKNPGFYEKCMYDIGFAIDYYRPDYIHYKLADDEKQNFRVKSIHYNIIPDSLKTILNDNLYLISLNNKKPSLLKKLIEQPRSYSLGQNGDGMSFFQNFVIEDEDLQESDMLRMWLFKNFNDSSTKSEIILSDKKRKIKYELSVKPSKYIAYQSIISFDKYRNSNLKSPKQLISYKSNWIIPQNYMNLKAIDSALPFSLKSNPDFFIDDVQWTARSSKKNSLESADSGRSADYHEHGTIPILVRGIQIIRQ